jgi:hypothetical protein
MLPYGGTPIRDLLLKQGRLRGDLTHPDYVFLDHRLNTYHLELTRAVRPWIHNKGVSHELNYAWDELETMERLVPGLSGAAAYRASLRALTVQSNQQLFRLVEESSVEFEQTNRSGLDPSFARDYCERTRKRLLAIRNQFVSENLFLLTESINADCVSGPMLAPQIH